MSHLNPKIIEKIFMFKKNLFETIKSIEGFEQQWIKLICVIQIVI